VLNLYKVGSDGGELTQLTFSEEGKNRNPVWSPDSSMIAYNSGTDYEQPAELWIVGADGSNPQMVYDNVKLYYPPAWNPGSSLLAIPAYGGGDTEEGGGLWLVPTDGSAPWVLPGTEGWSCSDPVWSPTDDGWPLFFNGYFGDKDKYGEDPSAGLWSYTPDGGVVHVDGADWGPVWCPNGTLEAAFGFGSGSKDNPVNEVHFFQIEPDLWP
jgi:Tol biopolymer transport system component